MAEWTIAKVLKTFGLSQVPRVRIPLPPPIGPNRSVQVRAGPPERPLSCTFFRIRVSWVEAVSGALLPPLLPLPESLLPALLPFPHSLDRRATMPRRPVGKRSTDEAGSVHVRGKAANGEGSVYYAGDGRWRATYRVAGESRPRTASGPTREKAIAARDRKLDSLASARRGGSRGTGGLSTIGDVAEWWLHLSLIHI